MTSPFWERWQLVPHFTGERREMDQLHELALEDDRQRDLRRRLGNELDPRVQEQRATELLREVLEPEQLVNFEATGRIVVRDRLGRRWTVDGRGRRTSENLLLENNTRCFGPFQDGWLPYADFLLAQVLTIKYGQPLPDTIDYTFRDVVASEVRPDGTVQIAYADGTTVATLRMNEEIRYEIR